LYQLDEAQHGYLESLRRCSQLQSVQVQESLHLDVTMSGISFDAFDSTRTGYLPRFSQGQSRPSCDLHLPDIDVGEESIL
jgi:hypothetical protein